MMHQSVARFHIPGRLLVRMAGLLALAALGPACYSSSGHNYMAPAGPGGGAGTLVSDGFFPYPNGNWTGATGSAATASSFFTGSQYFLRMQDTTRPGNISDITAMTFSSEALTFKIDFQSSATSTVTDQAFIQIVDSASPGTVLAGALYDASTGMITFSIGATAFPAVAYAAGSFQTITFTIDAGLGGTWMIGATNEGTAAFGTHTTKLKLGATWSASAGAAPIFDFDNLVISSP
jgi:hypothetical protein